MREKLIKFPNGTLYIREGLPEVWKIELKMRYGGNMLLRSDFEGPRNNIRKLWSIITLMREFLRDNIKEREVELSFMGKPQ